VVVKNWPRLLLVLSLTLGSGSLQAATAKIARDCQLYGKDVGAAKWRRLPGRFTVGRVVEAIKISDKWMVFGVSQSPKRQFAIDLSCVETAPVAPAEEVAAPTPTVTAPKPTPAERRVSLLYFGALSWQESLMLTTSAATNVPLALTTIGVLAGGGPRWTNGSFDFEARLSGGYLRAELRNQSTDVTLPQYTASNVGVLLGQLSGFAAWRPASKGVVLGVELPFSLRYGLWPDPPDGQVAARRGFFPGLSFEARLERGSVSLMQKVGLLKGTSSFFWLLGLAYDWDKGGG